MNARIAAGWAVCVILSLAGCGGGDAPLSEGGSSPPQNTTVARLEVSPSRVLMTSAGQSQALVKPFARAVGRVAGQCR